MESPESIDDSSELGQLSPLEERFERERKRWGLWTGPLLALVVYFWLAANYAPGPRRLAAVLTLVITYWVTEAIPIPVTALVGPALCVLLGVGAAPGVFASFADPIIFVFLGSFLLARAMAVNGLDRRVALWVLSLRGVGQSAFRVLVAASAVAVGMSMWVSNTATTAILYPIVLGVLGTLVAVRGRAAGGRRYATGVLLGVAYGSSVGGIATPVGSPPNLIGLGMIENLAQRKITFFEWMTLNLPLVAVTFVAMVVLLGGLHPGPRGRLEGLGQRLRELRGELAPWGRAQSYTLAAFLVAVTLWLLPGILLVARGVEDPVARAVSARLPEGVAALAGAALLFLLPLDWRAGPAGGSALPWREAVRIDWGTILLFGGGLSLGRMMYETGLAQVWANSLLATTGITSLWGITAASILIALLITETTSNTAAASMVVPVAIAVAQGAGVSPLPPALGATLAASFAFMLPVSTPPNAIVYGSGQVSILAMLRAGVLLDLIGGVVIWLGLRLLCPALGLV